MFDPFWIEREINGSKKSNTFTFVWHFSDAFSRNL